MMIMWELQNVLWAEYYDIIAQWLWVAWMLVLLYAFSQKDDIRSLKLATASLFLWLGHYLFLWLDSAVYATLIALLRMYFSFKYKWNILAMSFIIALTIILWVLSYDGFVSSLPIIASFFAIVAYQLFHWIQMRIAILLASFCWLYYMFVQQSIPWIANEIISEIILIITIFKIYKEGGGTLTFRQKALYYLKWRRPRRRIDFWKFVIFRDKKKYLEENDIVYENQ